MTDAITIGLLAAVFAFAVYDGVRLVRSVK